MTYKAEDHLDDPDANLPQIEATADNPSGKSEDEKTALRNLISEPQAGRARGAFAVPTTAGPCRCTG